LIKDAARRKHLSRYTSALQRYALLHAVETGSSSADSGPEFGAQSTPALIAEFEAPLAARFARASDAASNGSAADEHNLDRALDCLVRLESLAGIESPASERQRRMDYQVRKLSARMRQRESTDPEAELTTLLASWLALEPGLPEEFNARFMTAARAAVEALP
jgi:hypothetical protein